MALFNFFGKPNVKKLAQQGSIDGLIQALDYKDDWKVQKAAATALGTIGHPRAIEPLCNLIQDGEGMKMTAGFVMMATRMGKGRPVPLFLENFQHFIDVRLAAIFALQEIGDPRAIEPMRAAIDSSIDTVRGYAQVVLDELADPRDRNTVVDAVNRSEEAVWMAVSVTESNMR